MLTPQKKVKLGFQHELESQFQPIVERQGISGKLLLGGKEYQSAILMQDQQGNPYQTQWAHISKQSMFNKSSSRQQKSKSPPRNLRPKTMSSTEQRRAYTRPVVHKMSDAEKKVRYEKKQLETFVSNLFHQTNFGASKMDPKQVLMDIQGMISPSKNARLDSFRSSLDIATKRSEQETPQELEIDGKKLRDLTLKNVPYVGKQELDPESQKLVAKQIAA